MKQTFEIPNLLWNWIYPTFVDHIKPCTIIFWKFYYLHAFSFLSQERDFLSEMFIFFFSLLFIFYSPLHPPPPIRWVHILCPIIETDQVNYQNSWETESKFFFSVFTVIIYYSPTHCLDEKTNSDPGQGQICWISWEAETLKGKSCVLGMKISRIKSWVRERQKHL